MSDLLKKEPWKFYVQPKVQPKVQKLSHKEIVNYYYTFIDTDTNFCFTDDSGWDKFFAYNESLRCWHIISEGDIEFHIRPKVERHMNINRDVFIKKIMIEKFEKNNMRTFPKSI